MTTRLVELFAGVGAEIASLDRALITSTKRLAQAARHQPESDIASDETAYFGKLWASKTHERLVQEFIDRDKKPSA